MIGFVLNIPYTIIGLLIGAISLPKKIYFQKNPYAFVIYARSFWWAVGYFKGARGITFGHALTLGPNVEDKDLEHELIHVEQFARLPIIQPVLYFIELIKKGYRNNKYEDEAYRRAGNRYGGK